MDFYEINTKSNITAEDVTDLLIDNEVWGGTVALKADNAVGTSRFLVKGDPDGSVDLYYDGSIRVSTAASGLRANLTDFLVQNTQNAGHVSLVANDLDGTNRVLLRGDPDAACSFYYNGTKSFETAPYGINADSYADFVIINNVNSGTITLRAKDTGAITRTLIKGDPDGALDLYYDGTKVAETTANGISGAVWG